jgi:two-component system, NarL family, sensor kinase
LSNEAAPAPGLDSRAGSPFRRDRRADDWESRIAGRARPPLGGAETLAPLQAGLLRHYFRLQQAERRLSRLARKDPRGNVIRQVELERQRVGRELHTGVGQTLAAIRLQLDTVEAQLTAPPAPVRLALERISKLAQSALDQVRSLSRRLHPPEWQRLALEAAIHQLWELSGIPERYEASLAIAPLPRQPGLETRTLFYRAAQEAFSNIALHSRASRVQARLEMRGECLVLAVSDDGKGFDAAALNAAPPSLRSGIGLRAIREQAASLGGGFSVQTGPAGTRLEVSAPLVLDGEE